MRYRILSKEELEPLKDDFIKFLSANTITGGDWVRIKSNSPEKAKKIISIFSDIVWEKSLEKIKYLELRESKSLKVFYCGKKNITVLGFSITAKGAPSLLNHETIVKLGTGEMKLSELNAEFFRAKKTYIKPRSIEIFKMIEAGCSPCKKTLYSGINSLIK